MKSHSREAKRVSKSYLAPHLKPTHRQECNYSTLELLYCARGIFAWKSLMSAQYLHVFICKIQFWSYFNASQCFWWSYCLLNAHSGLFRGAFLCFDSHNIWFWGAISEELLSDAWKSLVISGNVQASSGGWQSSSLSCLGFLAMVGVHSMLES